MTRLFRGLWMPGVLVVAGVALFGLDGLVSLLGWRGDTAFLAGQVDPADLYPLARGVGAFALHLMTIVVAPVLVFAGLIHPLWGLIDRVAQRRDLTSSDNAVSALSGPRSPEGRRQNQ